MLRRVASILLVVGWLAPWASAQAPSNPPAPPGDRSSGPLFPPIPTDPAHPDYHAAAHRSIVRHNPLPRNDSYSSHHPYKSRESSQGQSGFSNPGGVGRYAEFYDRSTPTSQVDQHPVPVAQFDRGGGPDRAEQISAAEDGQQRARNIQSNINTFARPMGGYGYGYGLGLSGGNLYNYPF